MTNFVRIVTLSPLPDHQEGHVQRGWTITDETPEFWTAEREVKHPERLKEGENPIMTCPFSKELWKRVD